MANELKGEGLLEEDARLLVQQAQRCREILGRLSKGGAESDAMMDRIGLDLLLKEAAAPFIDARTGPAVIFEVKGLPDEEPPVLRRRPEIIYGLRNIIENAVAYGRSKVLVSADWSASDIEIEVHDDGRGFAPEILARLGEPYLGRGRARERGARSGGLGLGFFIAKTLLERTGAEIVFDNRPWREGGEAGAWIAMRWPRVAVESR
jgi:two-component system sensor histidine kinase RegB